LKKVLAYRLFAVLVVGVFQHCTGSLRSGAAEFAIELVDAHDVQALFASESYAARVFVDCVGQRHVEHTPAFFRLMRK